MNLVNNILHINVLDYKQNRVEYIYWKEYSDQSEKHGKIATTRLKESVSVCMIGFLITDTLTLNVEDRDQSFTSNPLLRWWVATQNSLAWRLLNVVKIGNKYEKQRAVKSLASLKNLGDWDYHMLAQACDARITAALARTEGCNLQFFLKPPKFFKNHLSDKELKEKTIDLLQAIENQHHHSCIENFLLAYEQQRWKIHSQEDSPGTSLSPLLEDELISRALNTLAHHCSIDLYAKDVFDVGGLPLLVELIYRFEKNTKVLSDIFLILSYMSSVPNALEVFHPSGCLGILAKWSRHKDPSLALPCTKSLANLDEDSLDRLVYPHNVFPLHPSFRSNGDYKADIIFVHGLLGTVFITWRQRDSTKLNIAQENTTLRPSFWSTLLLRLGLNSFNNIDDARSERADTSKSLQYTNQFLNLCKEDFEVLGNDFECVLADLPTASSRSQKESYTLLGTNGLVKNDPRISQYTQCWARDWLPRDCPNVRVLGINYATNLSQWFSKCPNQKKRARMADRSNEYMHMLKEVGVGKRPIIWVTHSMGGLLVKQMLISAYESDNIDMRNIFHNTKAVVFFSCPHLGSEVADLKMPTEMLFSPSLEVQELRYRSASLLDLHLRFLKLLEISPISILSFAETKTTNVTAVKWPVNFVQPHSADAGVGEFFEIPLDHIDICKPKGRHSFLYWKIIELINLVLHPL